jgi:hypothetical protein
VVSPLAPLTLCQTSALRRRRTPPLARGASRRDHCPPLVLCRVRDRTELKGDLSPTRAIDRFSIDSCCPSPLRERRSCADTVEKLEFQPRSRFRRPLAASMEISLGTRRSDRTCHVRSSYRPHRGNYWRGRHRARRSKIFARARFPSYSTISANGGRPFFLMVSPGGAARPMSGRQQSAHGGATVKRSRLGRQGGARRPGRARAPAGIAAL